MHLPLSFKARPVMMGGAALAVLAVGAAHGAGGISSHNSNAPVNYEADRIDLDDKANRVVLTGHVVITQAELKMTAARTVVDYTNNGSLKISLINSTGGVVVTRDNEKAVGDVGSYDFNRSVIVMAGNVTVTRGKDVSHGSRLVVDLKTGLSNFVGASGKPGSGNPAPGRVSGTFEVPQKKEGQ
ncbi:MAG: OstA family protein [Sphingomonadales bacterium]|nr:OstA family protein [Sphingomonadales bacterium]MDE2170075.1 OstA family protein [Sphingomonadales bacterium]